MFDLASVLRKKDELARSGGDHGGRVCGLVASVVSGLLPDSTTVVGAASDVLEAHEQLALVVTAIFCALLLWRLRERCSLPIPAPLSYHLLALADVDGCLYGGRMVYEFGVRHLTVRGNSFNW
jgi:uncharacterized membrane protein